MENTFTIGQMAKRLKVTVNTLQRWDREGRLKSLRTPTNRRYYTEQQLLDYFQLQKPEIDQKIVVYCRVSAQAQKPDLVNQIKILTEYCLLKDYGFEVVQEIGGGMNFKRPKFRELLKQVHEGSVSKIVIAHKDRLVRFGFEYFEWECNQFGCKIEVLNNEQLSPEQEMVQDLMTIIHTFSSRLYGLRNYKKELKQHLK